MEARVTEGYYQTDEIAIGSVVVTINDKKKMPMIKKRLQVFAACMRGGGGEACIEGKGRSTTV